MASFFQTALRNFIANIGRKCWSYADMYHLIRQTTGTMSKQLSQLPACFSMQPVFWEKAKELHDYSEKDGHEYAVSVFWVDGDLIITPPQRGDTTSVTTTYKIEVAYTPVDSLYTSKTVSINGEIVFSQSMQHYDVPQSNEVTLLFHVHTHPPDFSGGAGNTQKNYGFFSATDINTYLSGSSALYGVITDRIYLLIKPSDYKKPNEPLKNEQITRSYLTDTLHLALYEGSWDTYQFDRLF